MVPGIIGGGHARTVRAQLQALVTSTASEIDRPTGLIIEIIIGRSRVKAVRMRMKSS
jgi:hypothetical protein